MSEPVKVSIDLAVEFHEFSCEEVGTKNYPIYCICSGRSYNNIKEYANQCLWMVRENIERKSYDCDWLLCKAVEEMCRDNVVIIFTGHKGFDWCDDEAKHGRVALSDDDMYLMEMIAECDQNNYPKSFGETDRPWNLPAPRWRARHGKTAPHLRGGDLDIPF